MATTTTDRRSIIEKVRSILNRAAGTTFEGERDTAIALAKKLVDKHSLDAYDVGPLAHMVGLKTPPTADADFRRLVDEALRAASRTYASPFGSRQARQDASDFTQSARARQQAERERQARARRATQDRQARAKARATAGGRPYRATWTEGGQTKTASFATTENAWKWARKQGDRIQNFTVRVAA